MIIGPVDENNVDAVGRADNADFVARRGFYTDVEVLTERIRVLEAMLKERDALIRNYQNHYTRKPYRPGFVDMD